MIRAAVIFHDTTKSSMVFGGKLNYSGSLCTGKVRYEGKRRINSRRNTGSRPYVLIFNKPFLSCINITKST
jgi:hypothetical protein